MQILIVADFNHIISSLKDRFQGPLPGWEAQLKMASLRRLSHGKVISPPPNARLGSVMVLIYPVDGKAFTVFIRRNEYEGIHSGQISFPGGGAEAVDKSHADTALREAWEETGIVPEKVEVLGELTRLYIPPSNFLVFPIVATCPERPDFIPDPSEVQEIIEVELSGLKEPGIIQQREIVLSEDFSIMAPCYQVGGTVIWGATAMILSELLEMT
jgi:8-oxo-dGTP pyrophosphatase MutT (NUDIX family)